MQSPAALYGAGAGSAAGLRESVERSELYGARFTSLAGLAAAAAQAVEEDKKPKLLEAEPEGLVGEVAYEEGRYVRRDTRKGPSGE